LRLPLQKEDFHLWYGLFEKTVDDLFEGPKAEYAKEMATKIAVSFTVRMEMEGKFKT
jgi:hemoglobin